MASKEIIASSLTSSQELGHKGLTVEQSEFVSGETSTLNRFSMAQVQQAPTRNGNDIDDATTASMSVDGDDDDDEDETPSASTSVASTAFREQQELSRDLRQKLEKAQQDAQATRQSNINLMEHMQQLRDRKNVILLRRNGNKMRDTVGVTLATTNYNSSRTALNPSNGNKPTTNHRDFATQIGNSAVYKGRNDGRSTSRVSTPPANTFSSPVSRTAVVTPPPSSRLQQHIHQNSASTNQTMDPENESFAMTSVTGLTSVTLSSDPAEKEDDHSLPSPAPSASPFAVVPISKTSRRRSRAKSPALLDSTLKEDSQSMSVINDVIPEDEEDLQRYPMDRYASLASSSAQQYEPKDADEVEDWGNLIDQKIALADGLSDMKAELEAKRMEMEELEKAYATRKREIAMEMAHLETLRDELRQEIFHNPASRAGRPGMLQSLLRKFGFAQKAGTNQAVDESMDEGASDTKLNHNLTL